MQSYSSWSSGETSKCSRRSVALLLMVTFLYLNHLLGDTILVRRPDMAQGSWYEGHVHVLRQYEVGLRFNASFRGHTPASRYEVHFKLNRYPIRRQHQAMDTAWAESRVLFPVPEHIRGLIRPAPSRLRLNNPIIATNPPQLQAVTSIIRQESGAVPFIVFGPYVRHVVPYWRLLTFSRPGTGKTVTVVEAMLQVLQNKPSARILACAPSNSAADIIAERLAKYMNEDDLFRFYAPSRFKDQVPDVLLDYTCMKPGTHLFSVPPMARLKRFRVVVSTCVSASMPYGVGIPRGHFTHLFVDEAGQATEPEVMISIKTMCDRSTNVILSGDPRQLGPIIRSVFAQKLGLETSLLERLMQRDVYDEQTGHGRTCVAYFPSRYHC
jgi:helicase MOV-10